MVDGQNRPYTGSADVIFNFGSAHTLSVDSDITLDDALGISDELDEDGTRQAEVLRDTMGWRPATKRLTSPVSNSTTSTILLAPSPSVAPSAGSGNSTPQRLWQEVAPTVEDSWAISNHYPSNPRPEDLISLQNLKSSVPRVEDGARLLKSSVPRVEDDRCLLRGGHWEWEDEHHLPRGGHWI